MNGDRSRNTFDPTRHFSAVRLQQGRVITDADWNEQADLTRHHAELQALDLIGGSGAPVGNAGYELIPATYALAVQVLDDRAVWIAGEDGVLLRKKKENGQWGQWEVSDSETTAHLRSLHMVDDTGWAAGDAGTLLKLKSDGKWAAQISGTWRTLRGITSVNTEHAWAVGDGGVVLRTSDGGANWALVQTEATCLQAVHFSDAKSGLVVGNDGVILTTSDGGASWSRCDSGTEVHLYAVCFLDRVGWAAGDKGTILATQDGGKTWRVIREVEPKAAPLRAVTCLKADFILAAGDGGRVLYSNDGGTNWKEVGFKRRATLRAFSNSVDGVVWAVGDALMESQDDLQGEMKGRSVALMINVGSADQGFDADQDFKADILPDTRLSIMPGRYYVEGRLCELDARVTYYQQAGSLVELLQPGNAYLMYLNAWERHLSCIEAPSIREVALGGPDTATRSQTIGQVYALQLRSHNEGEEEPTTWGCSDEIPEWSGMLAVQPPFLAARATPQTLASNLCEIAKAAGYRRLENQLYRVEIHEGGSAPSFKWSRENGSVAHPVLSLMTNKDNQTVVTLSARGRDSNLDLAVGDCVELVDDDLALMPRVGMLFKYFKDGNDEREIVLDDVVPQSLGHNPLRHPLLRRWDHIRNADNTHAIPLVEGKWIDLEEGVQIWFEPGGDYRSGDYWEIPARTITGDVEWPRGEDGQPLRRPPEEGKERNARLGLIKVHGDGDIELQADCRVMFPGLINIDRSCCVSVGDGGEYPYLDTAIKKLLDKGFQDICLCLLPGDHRLSDSIDTQGKGVDLHVHGAGPASRLLLEGQEFNLFDFDSVTFEDFDIVGTSRDEILPLRFQGCWQLRLEHIHLGGMSGPGNSLVQIEGAHLIELSGCQLDAFQPAGLARALELVAAVSMLAPLKAALVPDQGELFAPLSLELVEAFVAYNQRQRTTLSKQLRTVLADQKWGFTPEEGEALQALGDDATRGGERLRTAGVLQRLRMALLQGIPGFALSLRDAGADTLLADNRINGCLSLYGEAAGWERGILMELMRQLAARRPEEEPIALEGGSELRLRNNRLRELRLGDELIERLKQLVEEGGTLDGIFRSLVADANVLSGPESELLARNLALSQNLLQPWGDVGVAFAVQGKYLGNFADNDFRLFVFGHQAEQFGNGGLNIV